PRAKLRAWGRAKVARRQHRTSGGRGAGRGGLRSEAEQPQRWPAVGDRGQRDGREGRDRSVERGRGGGGGALGLEAAVVVRVRVRLRGRGGEGEAGAFLVLRLGRRAYVFAGGEVDALAVLQAGDVRDGRGVDPRDCLAEEDDDGHGDRAPSGLAAWQRAHAP